MQRFAIALAAVLAAASSAQAVSVAITADQPSYLPGETITLSVIVDATGAEDTNIYGKFSYDTAILTGGSVSQNALTTLEVLPWVLNPVGCSNEPGFCVAFYQELAVSPFPVDQPAGFVISTITFTAGAVGSTDLVWSTSTGPGEFRFFGLTDAPGTTVQVVPEPATAVLFALGLVALGAAHRVRS